MADCNSYMFFQWQEGGLSSFNLRHSFSRFKLSHQNQVHRKRRLGACTPLASKSALGSSGQHATEFVDLKIKGVEKTNYI